jgi:hypothetical protein
MLITSFVEFIQVHLCISATKESIVNYKGGLLIFDEKLNIG